jgi:hypothetical protein
VHCRQPPRCLWRGGRHRHCECPEKQNSDSVLTCCNCDLQYGESPHPASCKAAIMQNRYYSAEEICGGKQRGQHGGCSSRNTLHLIESAALRSSDQQQRQQTSQQNRNSLQEKIPIRTPIKSQVNQCRLKM